MRISRRKERRAEIIFRFCRRRFPETEGGWRLYSGSAAAGSLKRKAGRDYIPVLPPRRRFPEMRGGWRLYSGSATAGSLKRKAGGDYIPILPPPVP